MEYSSYDGGEDGKHTGLASVEISGIFVMRVKFFFGADPLDREYI